MDVTEERSEEGAALAEHQAATAVERALGTLGWSGEGDDPWAHFPQARGRRLVVLWYAMLYCAVLCCAAAKAGSMVLTGCTITLLWLTP